MKKTLLVILALVMAVTLVMVPMSMVSAATLPSLNVSLTNALGMSGVGGSHENINCTASMIEELTTIDDTTVPPTGGTATGRFAYTYSSSSDSQYIHITGNVIYLSVGEDSITGTKEAWVTVEITQQSVEYPQYLLVLFDQNGGFGMQSVFPDYAPQITPESTLFQYVNENLTSDSGMYGHISINIPNP